MNFVEKTTVKIQFKNKRRVISTKDVIKVFQKSNFNFKTRLEQIENSVSFDVFVSMLHHIAAAFSSKTYHVLFCNTKYSTVFVKFPKDHLQFMINSKIFAFINFNIEFPIGFQCFLRSEIELYQFINDYLEDSIRAPIEAIAPFALMEKKYKNPNPLKWPKDANCTKEEIIEFVKSPSHIAKLQQFLTKYNPKGELKNYIIKNVFELRDQIDPNDDIIEHVFNRLNEDAYDIVLYSLDPELEPTEDQCDEIYHMIQSYENDNSVDSFTSHPLENWNLDDHLYGNFDFYKIVQITLDDSTYLLYNTLICDKNLEKSLNWFLQDIEKDQLIGINYIMTKSFYRLIFTVKGKIILMTSVSPNKAKKNLPLIHEFLEEHKFIYNNDSLLQFLETKLNFRIKLQFYPYIELCFLALKIQYEPEYYCHYKKKQLNLYSTDYEPKKSNICDIAVFHVFYYESFLKALEQHPDLFAKYDEFQSNSSPPIEGFQTNLCLNPDDEN